MSESNVQITDVRNRISLFEQLARELWYHDHCAGLPESHFAKAGASKEAIITGYERRIAGLKKTIGGEKMPSTWKEAMKAASKLKLTLKGT